MSEGLIIVGSAILSDYAKVEPGPQNELFYLVILLGGQVVLFCVIEEVPDFVKNAFNRLV